MTTITIDLDRALAPSGLTTLGKNAKIETAWAETQMLTTGPKRVLVTNPSYWTLPNGVGQIEAEPTPENNALRITVTEGLQVPYRIFVKVPASGPVDIVDLVQVDPRDLSPTGPVTPLWLAQRAADVAARIAADEDLQDQIDAIPDGPVGPPGAPGGSDAATAEWLRTGELSKAALGEEIATAGSPANLEVIAQIDTAVPPVVDDAITEADIPGQVQAGITSSSTVTAAVNAAAAPAVASAVSSGTLKSGYVAGLSTASGIALARNEYVNPDSEGPVALVFDLSTGTPTISTDTFAGWPEEGTKSVKVTNSGSASYRVKNSLGSRPAASNGQIWHLRMRVFNPMPTARIFQPTMMSFYAGDTATERGVVAGADFACAAGTATWVTMSYTTPTPVAPDAVATVGFKIASRVSGGATTGDSFYVDSIDLYRAATPRTVHLSGSQSTAYFTGTANDSPSTGLLPGALASSGLPVWVTEGPLSFTDPRVGGVADTSMTSLVDNAAALNTAYTMLNSVGGTLFVPKGVYPFRTAPNPQPGGVWVRGEGFDYSTPSSTTVRPSRGSVFRALAAMTHLLHLGNGPALGPGQTGAAVEMMSLDGNNLADSTLWAHGSRNKIHRTQVYSGKLRAYLCAGQNVHATESTFAQDNVGDVILVQGATVLDNKIWTSQIRSPGPTGAAVRIGPGAVATDLQMCHLWAGGGGIPAAAEALVVIEADGIAGNINTLITDNTIEGVLGPEILFNGKNGGTISTTGIFGNKFYANDTMPDNTHPIIVLLAGIMSTLSVTGNTATGPASNRRYKSFIDVGASVTASGGFVISGNVLRFVASMLTGTTLPTRAEYGPNQLHNGTEWLRTSNRGTATFTGDGTATSFTIPHKLVASPQEADVTAGSPAAAAPSYTTWDGTSITVTFLTPPANGATVKVNWRADC